MTAQPVRLHDPEPEPEPLLGDVHVVATMLGMAWRSVLREADRNPDFPQPIKFGQRKARSDGRVDARFTRWRLAEVRAFAMGAQ